jgi:hypothetical protein
MRGVPGCVRALAPFRRRGFISAQAGRDAGLSIMMGGTDVLLSYDAFVGNSQKSIETIDEPGLIVEIHSDVNRDR